MTTQKRRTILTRSALFVALLAAAGATWYVYHKNNQNEVPTTASATQGGQGKKASGRPSRPLAPVQFATAQEKVVPRFLSGLGTVQAANMVTVTSRVEGQLMNIYFTEGQSVKAGDLLAQIDPRPFEVQLAQAEGQLAKDKATLANARLDLTRYQKLAGTKVISQQELDNQRATVLQAEGSIKVDQAAVDNAKLQLTYSKITAPISGRIGLKQVDVGNFISSGTSTPIVVITQTQPADVLFALPEGDIPAIQQAQAAGNKVLIEAWDRNNIAMIARGELLSTDNQIDPATGTLKIKARFTNEEQKLFPNQFVNVKMQVETLQNAVVIPTAALQMGNEGHYVWVLSDDDTVTKHLVTVGIQDSQQVVIESGLSANTKVITDGVDKLTDGAKVEVVNASTLEKKPASAEKKPRNSAEKA
ncbi:MdtA/MuxA family multidrug efflux RND transporter periplasmic adaptor subunit [Providencia sp. JGM181]|jgi:multidrug efflux system membrane fusion protein|uniref:MdtA/MuxA family multidrug efflux RND transporter periplasmic adaptor subunit n=1 Tax=unclassified Providencia TaxID=2633465 RepID=UPI001BABC94B|nr:MULTISPECIES: MdtA/MuxA family multidrug efflux RND transporter periplasmic adaptor subunit [unclassified Providencia]MBS0924565.1 MdtA/MuxA family multidrug efflux RND transporter periplasmic adaptor subunit [Providencia sp. JGM181]MBS0932794.1 MdtA/MuxA family multidrug efflux RND transporter periplasmic adaptor subunit [Providencia sp. JGM172]MBS0996987.1 MdtA/MuxA family multidrug efflux RND transporter periplasmic adaptor subunit [Providencia sp. JGM178]